MRRAKLKPVRKPEPGTEHASVTGAEFLLSIVETHKTQRNGKVIGMESGLKAQQELDKIEEQISRLESLEGKAARPIARFNSCTTG